eukprot:1697963-Amphidinium_carterae.1
MGEEKHVPSFERVSLLQAVIDVRSPTTSFARGSCLVTRLVVRMLFAVWGGAHCQAKATFFICSDYVAGVEKDARRLLRDGHELGNHCPEETWFVTLTCPSISTSGAQPTITIPTPRIPIATVRISQCYTDQDHH